RPAPRPQELPSVRRRSDPERRRDDPDLRAPGLRQQLAVPPGRHRPRGNAPRSTRPRTLGGNLARTRPLPHPRGTQRVPVPLSHPPPPARPARRTGTDLLPLPVPRTRQPAQPRDKTPRVPQLAVDPSPRIRPPLAARLQTKGLRRCPPRLLRRRTAGIIP